MGVHAGELEDLADAARAMQLAAPAIQISNTRSAQNDRAPPAGLA
jgi:hypothetical protein